MTEIRLDTAGKRPHFFGDPAIDAMMTALLETMSENWALRERVSALEHALQAKGVLAPGEVENVALPDAVKQQIARQQQEVLTDAFRALNADLQSRADRQRDLDHAAPGAD